MDNTRITVVPAIKAFEDYKQGDMSKQDGWWMLKCPGCGKLSSVDRGKIIENDENTVSTRAFLHCHGRTAHRRYVIEKNVVRWL